MEVQCQMSSEFVRYAPEIETFDPYFDELFLTVEWPERLSPFVTVGRVHLPRQDISGLENFEKGDALAFNQWRVTADHRPFGRDHAAATDLYRVGQGPPDVQQPAANRAD
jgi:hypothetical protein